MRFRHPKVLAAKGSAVYDTDLGDKTEAQSYSLGIKPSNARKR
jgi:hypothetical protein